MTNAGDTGAGSFRQALVDASSGDTISFAIPNDSTITLTSPILINKNVSLVNNSGYSVQLVDALSGHGVEVVSSTVLDIGGASPFTISASTTDGTSAIGIFTPSGGYTVDSLGENTTLNAQAAASNAYGMYANTNIDIGTLAGTVNATANTFGTGIQARSIGITTLSGLVSATGSDDTHGLYATSGDIDITTLSGTVSAKGGIGYAYGLYSNSGNIDIDTLSGAVSATSTSYSAHGLYSNSGDINISTLSGAVSATGSAYNALGLDAGDDLSIGTLSGTVSATNIGGVHYAAMGLFANSSFDIGTLSGAVSATSTHGFAFGLDSQGDMSIDSLSGAVSARSEDYRAFGIKSFGVLNGGDSATAAKITGTVSAVGGSYASAIEADGATNLYVAGTLYAEDTSGGGNAWAVKSGGADDRLTLATGADLTGIVDLGGGSDLLTLLGDGTSSSTFLNIENLVVGDGSAETNWTWDTPGATSFDAVDILSSASFLVGNGATIQSPVAVHAGGTLGGYGAIIGNVTNAGTVAPGGSIGTLTINGDYTQTASGTLQMEIAPSTADLLRVTGVANLDGRLVIVPTPGLYSTGASWSLIDAVGGINGDFASVTVDSTSPTLHFLANGSLTSYNLSYTGSDSDGGVTISTFRTPYTPYALGGRTMGLAQLLSSAAYDATGEMAEMLGGLDFSSGAEISYAMESLSAESYDAFSQSALEGGRALTSAQRAGLRSGGVAPGRTYIGDLNQGGGTSDAPQSTGLAADEGAGSANSPELTVFLEPFGMHANQGSSSDRVGYDAMTWGLAAGFLYHPTENWTLGIAPGFFSQNLQEDGPGDGDGSVVEWSIAALIGYQTDDLYLDGMARLGFDSFRSNKDLVLPGMPRSADARWNGTNLTFAVGGGYDFHVGGFTFGPVGSLAWSNLHEDSFEESDAGLLGQHIRARNSQSLNTELGARITRTFESEYGDITPELRMVWNAEWLSDERSITSSFIGYAGGRYSAQLADQRYHAGLLDAGLTWAVNDRFSIVARSSVELFRPDHDSLSGSLRLQYTF